MTINPFIFGRAFHILGYHSWALWEFFALRTVLNDKLVTYSEISWLIIFRSMYSNSIDPEIFLSLIHEAVPIIFPNSLTKKGSQSRSIKLFDAWKFVGPEQSNSIISLFPVTSVLSSDDCRPINHRLALIVFELLFLSLVLLGNILGWLDHGFFHCWSCLFLNFLINKLLRLFLVSLRDKKVLILQRRFINFIIFFSLLSFNTHNSIIF